MGGRSSSLRYAHSSPLRAYRSRKGFTLFELILVLALLVVVCAAIYPNLEAMYGDSKITSSGDMVRAAWAEAQSLAINEGRAYRFSVQPYTGNYRVAPDNSGWSGGDSGPRDASSSVVEKTLDKGVRFAAPETSNSAGLDQGNNSPAPASSTDSGSWTTVVTFLPDGTARENASIIISARGARQLELRIRGLTGVITSKTLEGKRR